MDYKIIRSNRRTLSLEINESLQVIVRSPFMLSSSAIDEFVLSKKDWIDEKTKLLSKRLENKKSYSSEDILRLQQKARLVLPEKIEYWSNKMHLYPTGVKITSAKKRFGSCNAKNSLCFSVYLFDYPDKAIDYVVVHELAHIKEHNHSKGFWQIVKQYLPDYKQREALLKGF